jgi:hypothetical protein
MPERYYNSVQKISKLCIFAKIRISAYFLLFFFAKPSNFQPVWRTFFLRPERVKGTVAQDF